MTYAAKRSKNRCPTHPGALLRDDVIPATGRTKAEIAGLLGISRQHLYDILQEEKDPFDYPLRSTGMPFYELALEHHTIVLIETPNLGQQGLLMLLLV